MARFLSALPDTEPFGYSERIRNMLFLMEKCIVADRRQQTLDGL